MSKELVITATAHETRVAILEDGQLCEIYVEREKEFALVGSIYKGRVTRVLPGMQSAFVDIALDSDAFLYVSDFLEAIDDYEQIVTTVEEKVEKMEAQGGQVFAPTAGQPAPPAPPATAPRGSHETSEAGPPGLVTTAESVRAGTEGLPPAQPSTSFPPGRPTGYEQRPYSREHGGRRRRGRRGRDRDRDRHYGHGRELPPSKVVSQRSGEPRADELEPIILPGESLEKYRDRVPPPPLARTEEAKAAAVGISPGAMPATPPSGARAGGETAPGETPQAAEPALQESTEVSDGLPAAADLPKSPGAAELSAEEATALAEQLAEAQREEAEAAAADEESEAGEEEPLENGGPLALALNSAAGMPESLAETGHPEGAGEAGALEAETPEMPSGAAEGEPQSVEQLPALATRVEQPNLSRFQQPIRPAGRHRGGHPGRATQRHVPARRPQLISEMLRTGQEIIVQIAKEPLGKKGARITSHVALPGRYLVYMPTVEHIGVSRKIASLEHRARLRRLVTDAKSASPGGFIVRTAAEAASDEEVRNDVEFLTKSWNEIKARADQRKAPALLHRDLNLVERVLRDHLGPDYNSIWVDSEEEFSKVVEFVNRFQSDLVNRVRLYTKPAPIFEEFGIQQEMDKALRPKVWLKSGGYIVINHTEALVAIDVNTGKFVGKGSTRLEDTIVKTNLEAVKEIVRQIRLRDLGGIIVIDFIDMEERKNRQKVMQALEDALREDRAPSKVLSFNEFGLVAITRKRTKQALERTLCQPCPYCSGSGMVKSIPTLCYEIQAEARKMAQDLEGESLTLRVNPEIAKALKTRESALIEELEQSRHKSVIIQSDPTLHWEQYDIY
jgi:ribonuclease G